MPSLSPLLCSDTPVLQESTLALAPSPNLMSPPVWPSSPVLQQDTPAVSPSANPTIQSLRLPRQKPPEIETLVHCRASNVPLLVFVSQESGFLPQPLPAEYAYVCLGFFFVSELNVSFPSVILTAPFIDFPTGGGGRHNHKCPDTRHGSRKMADYIGVGSRRRTRVTRRYQCKVLSVVDRPLQVSRRKRSWLSKDAISSERSERPVLQFSAIGPPGRFQA